MSSILKISLVSFVALFAFSAFAEKKTFTVKGMHCESCADSVRSALCKNPAYTSCKVKIKNSKKELGEVTLETKDAPIDMQAVKAILEEKGYQL